jgi:O-antigen ligase
MILLLQKFNLNKTYQYLLISLGFFLPLTVSLANLIIVIIVLLWLFSGDYKEKYKQIINSKLMIASLMFYFIHVMGMFWTEDLDWGFSTLHKMWYFLLLWPVLFTIVNKDYTKYYIYAFLLAMALSEIVSYLIWFEAIPPFKNALTSSNPTPFMSHISFNPFLAFTIYVVIHEVLFNKKLNKLMLGLYSFFSVALIFNMFITGGRAGQVVFFVMIIILILQYFQKQKLKAIIATIILLPAIFITAYHTSPIFNQRANLAFQELVKYDKNRVAINQSVVSSVGARILFANNSWAVIKENSLLGVGTGDFPTEYLRINVINSPTSPSVTNPHNMYLLVLVQSGIVGLLSMLSIFYYQIKLSFKESNRFFCDLGFALPLLFLVIMLSDSYLLGHYTSLLFVFFSSFLYKNFEKD